MALLDEVVVSATKKDFVATIVDSDDVVQDISGGSVRMQGRSSDLSSVTIDVAGVLTDPAQGVVTFEQIGTLITQAQLTAANVAAAIFTLRLKYTDALGEFDFGDEFQLKFTHLPTELPA